MNYYDYQEAGNLAVAFALSNIGFLIVTNDIFL
jgi:hypothetical protein